MHRLLIARGYVPPSPMNSGYRLSLTGRIRSARKELDHDHQWDDRHEGHRQVRQGQRPEPLLRDARCRTAADPPARRTHVERDVRARPTPTLEAPPGYRP